MGPAGNMGRRGSQNLDEGSMGGGGGGNWKSRGVPPSPGGRGGGGGGSRGGVSLHRTTNRWQGGKVLTDDPEEEKRQKTFKGLLNKLTVDTFEKLSKMVRCCVILLERWRGGALG
jgi:translation initiation factor 4G